MEKRIELYVKNVLIDIVWLNYEKCSDEIKKNKLTERFLPQTVNSVQPMQVELEYKLNGKTYEVDLNS
jgi:hypothetical protein